uniref:Uncharacterized protein n=1 Tax=Scaphoideus titanus permutotetra-like virus 1 TaxID=2716555 RepID=A0A6G7NRY6_9VIRU|nr:hypothetical protein [Scaphoideus titanus permutotetra-like virus 1]
MELEGSGEEQGLCGQSEASGGGPEEPARRWQQAFLMDCPVSLLTLFFCLDLLLLFYLLVMHLRTLTTVLSRNLMDLVKLGRLAPLYFIRAVMQLTHMPLICMRQSCVRLFKLIPIAPLPFWMVFLSLLLSWALGCILRIWRFGFWALLYCLRGPTLCIWWSLSACGCILSKRKQLIVALFFWVVLLSCMPPTLAGYEAHQDHPVALTRHFGRKKISPSLLMKDGGKALASALGTIIPSPGLFEYLTFWSASIEYGVTNFVPKWYLPLLPPHSWETVSVYINDPICPNKGSYYIGIHLVQETFWGRREFLCVYYPVHKFGVVSDVGDGLSGWANGKPISAVAAEPVDLKSPEPFVGVFSPNDGGAWCYSVVPYPVISRRLLFEYDPATAYQVPVLNDFCNHDSKGRCSFPSDNYVINQFACSTTWNQARLLTNTSFVLIGDGWSSYSPQPGAGSFRFLNIYNCTHFLITPNSSDIPLRLDFKPFASIYNLKDIQSVDLCGQTFLGLDEKELSLFDQIGEFVTGGVKDIYDWLVGFITGTLVGIFFRFVSLQMVQALSFAVLSRKLDRSLFLPVLFVSFVLCFFVQFS